MQVSKSWVLEGATVGVMRGDVRILDYSPFDPFYNPSSHVIFNFLVHVILHYRGLI